MDFCQNQPNFELSSQFLELILKQSQLLQQQIAHFLKIQQAFFTTHPNHSHIKSDLLELVDSSFNISYLLNSCKQSFHLKIKPEKISMSENEKCVQVLQKKEPTCDSLDSFSQSTQDFSNFVSRLRSTLHLQPKSNTQEPTSPKYLKAKIKSPIFEIKNEFNDQNSPQLKEPPAKFHIQEFKTLKERNLIEKITKLTPQNPSLVVPSSQNHFFKFNSVHPLENTLSPFSTHLSSIIDGFAQNQLPIFGQENKTNETLKQYLQVPQIQSVLKTKPSLREMPNNLGFCRPRKIQKPQRGHYQICTSNTKLEAVHLAMHHPPKKVAEIMNIPEKNIKRWLVQGVERKKGAGRKMTDPSMEDHLLEWIRNFHKIFSKLPDQTMLKTQAFQFSSNSCFKASKGWCDKFIKRNGKFLVALRKVDN